MDTTCYGKLNSGQQKTSHDGKRMFLMVVFVYFTESNMNRYE